MRNYKDAFIYSYYHWFFFKLVFISLNHMITISGLLLVTTKLSSCFQLLFFYFGLVLHLFSANFSQSLNNTITINIKEVIKYKKYSISLRL
jgi:hypothetical protein